MALIGRKKLKESMDDIYVRQNDNLRGVYLAGLAKIVAATPADTGRARNNWFLSIGAPSGATTTAKSKGLATIRSLRKMPQRVLNRKIYFSNNLPYIGVLEYGGYPNKVKKGTYLGKGKGYEKRSAGGYSKQLIPLSSPAGWVRSTLISMQNKIRSL